MKNYLYLAILLVLTLSCNCNEKEINVSQEKDTISSVLNTWHKAAADANFEGYFSKMAANSIFIGTDADENWSVAQFKDFSKPYFEKGKAWSFKAVERNIYLYENGEIAWFDELLDTWMGVCRGSGVLQKNNETWEIKHYVLSLTVPNDNIKDIVNVNKKHDSIFLQSFKN